jgi:hypothetical protein
MSGADRAKFQNHMKAKTPTIPEEHNGNDIDTCVKKISGAIVEAVAASNPKGLSHEDPCPRNPGSIQDKILIKCRLRKRWQDTSDPAQSRGQPPPRGQ